MSRSWLESQTLLRHTPNSVITYQKIVYYMDLKSQTLCKFGYFCSWDTPCLVLHVSAAAFTHLLTGWQELCAFVFIVVELHSHFSYTHLAHKVPNALFSHLGDGNHFCK